MRVMFDRYLLSIDTAVNQSVALSDGCYPSVRVFYDSYMRAFTPTNPSWDRYERFFTPAAAVATATLYIRPAVLSH